MVQMIRVHDVNETKKSLSIIEKLSEAQMIFFEIGFLTITLIDLIDLTSELAFS